MSDRRTLEAELTELINRHSAESASELITGEHSVECITREEALKSTIHSGAAKEGK